MSRPSASLSEHLRRRLRDIDADAPLCVALSGGADSVALLHALHGRVARGRLRALHVDHGLHPDSAAWSDLCARLCAGLDVPLDVHRVHVQARGEGLEAAARHARYAVFEAALPPGGYLLTAHHRDDQAETVLLKLMRGAGPHGLAGVRPLRPLGRGWLWRPLLDLPRDTLRRHLDAHRLAYVEDPANSEPAHSRNLLRHAVLPVLASHWPQAGRVLAASAARQREVADFLDAQVDTALQALLDDGRLEAGGWLALHAALRPLVLERWLHDRHLPAPTGAQREQLERQLRQARNDRLPCVDWPGAQVRVWRGFLHALPPLRDPPAGWQATWHGPAQALPAGAGTLGWSRLPVDPPALTVRLDVPGARLRPAGDSHTRDVRDLYQRQHVPPWRRRRCPFIYAGDGTLLSVGGLWHSMAGRALFDTLGAEPVWRADC